MHACMHAYIHTYTHTNIHMHPWTHAYIHTHTHTQTFWEILGKLENLENLENLEIGKMWKSGRIRMDLKRSDTIWNESERTQGFGRHCKVFLDRTK